MHQTLLATSAPERGSYVSQLAYRLQAFRVSVSGLVKMCGDSEPQLHGHSQPADHFTHLLILAFTK